MEQDEFESDPRFCLCLQPQMVTVVFLAHPLYHTLKHACSMLGPQGITTEAANVKQPAGFLLSKTGGKTGKFTECLLLV